MHEHKEEETSQLSQAGLLSILISYTAAEYTPPQITHSARVIKWIPFAI